MSALDQIFAVGGISDLRHPTAWLLDSMLGRQTRSGVAVSPEGAMALSAYYACIRNVAEDIGGLPFKVFRKLSAREREPAPDHPLYPILHDEANDNQSSMAFRELVLHWAQGWGDGYAEIERRGNNQVVGLHPLHPSQVTVKQDRDTQRIVYDVRNDNGVVVEMPPDSIFHLRGLGGELNGYSIARIGAESLGRAIATQEFSASFFGNGSTFSGVYTVPGKLDKDARKRLKESWPKGLPNAHNPLFLESDMKWQSIAVPPEQAQMLETMQFTVADVARWFRMPLHKIQSMEAATFSNIEHQAREYVGDTLIPWIRRLENEVNRKLLSAADRETFVAEIVVRGLLRGDLQTQSAYYTSMSSIGVLSINEIRSLEGMNPIPGGDEHLVPMNMQPSGEDTTDETEPEDDEDEQTAPPANVSAFKQAHAGVFRDAAERLVRKEVNALSRAMKRYDNDASFSEWSRTFYEEHRGHCYATMVKPALALAETLCVAQDAMPLPAAVVEAVRADVKDWAFSFATVISGRDIARDAIAAEEVVGRELSEEMIDRVDEVVCSTLGITT